MARLSRSQLPLQAIAIEGVLATLAPAVFLFTGPLSAPLAPWRFAAAITTALLCLGTASFLPRRPSLAKWTGFLAITGAGFTAGPDMLHDPATALLWAITLLALDLAVLTWTGSSLAAGAPRIALLAVILPNLLIAIGKTQPMEPREQWWEPLLNHPSRVLFTTFFGLCCLGAILLLLPQATSMGIALTDAAFTAVSAVCVTGLTVVDTPSTFTPLGLGCLLLLIQLGGLGIMTLTTVALHALGKRLSLRQERLLTSLTETSHQDLVVSLLTIIRFTFLVEAAGSLLLGGLFLAAGDSLPQALWRGLFTSISAFCNAGFALQSDSLIAYQTNPLILHTIAALIVFGGLAPATSLLLPHWLKGQ